jgi:putative inorganic carbon (hco3(-)) transporter
MSSKLLPRLSLYIFYGLLAYMPFHIFLSTWLGTGFGVLEFAKIAKDIVLIAGFLFAFCISFTKPWFRQLLRDRLIWLIMAYAFLTVLLAAIKPTDPDAEILGVVYNLRFLLFFLYALLLTRLFDAKKLWSTSVKIVLITGGMVVLFGIVQYLILPDDALKQVGYSRKNGVLPAFFIDDKPDLERIMSTIRDPNSLGSYLVILAPLFALTWFRQKTNQRKALFASMLFLTAVCSYLTFSRSGWIGLVVAMATFVALSPRFKQTFQKHQRSLLVGSIFVIAVASSSLYLARNSYFVQNTLLHADQSTVLEDPNELRVRFFRESVEGIVDAPLGNGPGTAGLASIRNNVQGTQLNENYYLQIATEVGILGLALFLAILAIVGWRLYAAHQGNSAAVALLASFVGLAVTNFLVHIWANEAVAYTWWGLVGIFLGTKISSRHSQKS